MSQYFYMRWVIPLMLATTWLVSDSVLSWPVALVLLWMVRVQFRRLVDFFRSELTARVEAPWRLVDGMDVLVQLSGNRIYQNSVLSGAFSLPLVLLPFLTPAPWLWALVGLWLAVSAFIASAVLLMPPYLLLLGRSSRAAVELQTNIVSAVFPVRMVHLLRLIPGEGLEGYVQKASMATTTMRTYSDGQWRRSVAFLLEVVGVVLIAPGGASEPLDEEFEMVRTRGLSSKTVFVGSNGAERWAALGCAVISEECLLERLRQWRKAAGPLSVAVLVSPESASP
jgi:hypothetical protein